MNGLIVTVINCTLDDHLHFRMALEIYDTFVVEQDDVHLIVLQGHLEVLWVTHAEAMCRAFASRANWNPHTLATLLDVCVRTWPLTLTQRLAWGPMPHYGVLGGVSGHRMEASLDSLDHVVADTVRRTGRTVWTDLAWRRVARLGTVQRRCPDCGQAGPEGQMAAFGAIFACELCEGVTWGGAVYH